MGDTANKVRAQRAQHWRTFEVTLSGVALLHINVSPRVYFKGQRNTKLFLVIWEVLKEKFKGTRLSQKPVGVLRELHLGVSIA